MPDTLSQLKDAPRMPPPSATVEPFISGGGPPPMAPEPPKRRGKGPLVVILLMLVAAVIGAFYALPSLRSKLGLDKSAAPSPSTTPTASPNTDADVRDQSGDLIE